MRDHVYLSGPMTGVPDLNRPAFNAAADQLRAMGMKVINPAELPDVATWEEAMRIDLAQLVTDCHALIMLPGWHTSKGALIEIYVAAALKMPRIEYTDTAALAHLATFGPRSVIGRDPLTVVHIPGDHP